MGKVFPLCKSITLQGYSTEDSLSKALKPVLACCFMKGSDNHFGASKGCRTPFPRFINSDLVCHSLLIRDGFLTCSSAVHVLSTQHACECTGGFGLVLPKLPAGGMSQPDSSCAEPVKMGIISICISIQLMPE